MRPVMALGTEDVETFGVLVAAGPAVELWPLERRVVVHVEDRVVVERAARLTREPGPGDRGGTGGGPDVMLSPGASTLGRADALPAGCSAAALVTHAGGDWADAGPSVHDGSVHNPQDIPRVNRAKRSAV